MAKKNTEVPLRAPMLKRPVDAKGVVVQLKPDSWRALRQLALDESTSVQRLGIEAELYFSSDLERWLSVTTSVGKFFPDGQSKQNICSRLYLPSQIS